MVPEVALDPSGRQRGSEVAEVALSLLMVERWLSASLMLQRCQRWLSLPADGSEAGRALSAFLVALSGSDGREVALLPLMDQGGLSGGSDAARGGSASLLMVARQGELSLMVERWQRCQRWQGGREVALLPSFLLMVPEVALDPSGRQGGRTGRGRAASLPADGREVAEVAESHLLLYIYVIDVIGLH